VLHLEFLSKAIEFCTPNLRTVKNVYRIYISSPRSSFKQTKHILTRDVSFHVKLRSVLLNLSNCHEISNQFINSMKQCS
jgi:hypothetical protein